MKSNIIYVILLTATGYASAEDNTQSSEGINARNLRGRIPCKKLSKRQCKSSEYCAYNKYERACVNGEFESKSSKADLSAKSVKSVKSEKAARPSSKSSEDNAHAKTLAVVRKASKKGKASISKSVKSEKASRSSSKSGKANDHAKTVQLKPVDSNMSYDSPIAKASKSKSSKADLSAKSVKSVKSEKASRSSSKTGKANDDTTSSSGNTTSSSGNSTTATGNSTISSNLRGPTTTLLDSTNGASSIERRSSMGVIATSGLMVWMLNGLYLR